MGHADLHFMTQEAMAPSRHDWKIVDWDVKPQHNQLHDPQLNVTRMIEVWPTTCLSYFLDIKVAQHFNQKL